jgi:hypothetical protein
MLVATTALPVPVITTTPRPAPPTATLAVKTATFTAIPSSPTASPQPGGDSGAAPAYLDDRSSPSGLVLSLFNAINRKEYMRAYSYWIDPVNNEELGSYEQFKAGYQETNSVQVTLGNVSAGAGAGQRYYAVPVLLKSQTSAGQPQTFVGCYNLHMSNPIFQAEPPYRPMGIRNAYVNPLDPSLDANEQLAAACSGGDPQQVVPTTDPETIAATNYLDNRSSALAVLRSLFNAINSKEYVRAYSYWKEGSPVAPFAQFQKGYEDTEEVKAVFGVPTDDLGAGQIRYRVPVTLTTRLKDGKQQVFVGCYQLHLSQPAIQETYPFRPMAIEKASVQQIQAGTDPAPKMAAVCTHMP